MFSQQALTVCTQQEESIKVQNKSFSLLHPCNKCVHYTFLLKNQKKGKCDFNSKSTTKNNLSLFKTSFWIYILLSSLPLYEHLKCLH